MKFKMILTAFLLVFMVVGMPMILPGPGGKPIMSWEDWLPGEKSVWQSQWRKLVTAIQGISDGVESSTGVRIGPEPTKLYKWQDAQGKWHFSDKVPPEAVAYQEMDAPTQVNSMAPPPEIFTEEEDVSINTKPRTPSFPSPTTVSPADIPKMIEDAQNIEKVLQQRNDKLMKDL